MDVYDGRAGIFFVFLLMFATLTRAAPISRVCLPNQECLIELPGTMCADGSHSFMTLTKAARPARNLLVYLDGGGACWSAETCRQRYATALARREKPTDWIHGLGIHNRMDPANPFSRDYDIITVPYCTGDMHAGNSVVDYGTPGAPYVIRHHGYANTVLTLEAVKQLYPEPDKAVFVGCSAGGEGVLFHLRNFASAFPGARKYVVSDAGVPFRPPFIKPEKYRALMHTWGIDRVLAELPGPKPLEDLAQLIAYNQRNYPDVRFGMLGTYHDRVMTFFALAVGSMFPSSAVQSSLVYAADRVIGRDSPNARVFFTNTSNHCQTALPLEGIIERGKSLAGWLSAMVSEGRNWTNVRPDVADSGQ